MKIDSVSCRQFAGLRNLKPVQFKDGLNVVYGPNESGKSTLVGLIYSLLWQNCKVNGKTDKAYLEEFFPAEVLTGAKGRTIDGKLVVEGEDGTYTISKKWATGSTGFSGEMETPSALLDEVTDKSAFEETLKSLLQYGEGVYKEAIFANQKTTDSILEALLKGKLKSDLSAVATSAMLDMGGISSEKFLNAISEKMRKLGANWDFKTDGPVNGRGLGDKHQKNVGDILSAYYRLEEHRAKLADLRKKSAAFALADKNYAKAAERYDLAFGALEEFSRYDRQLENYRKASALKAKAEDDLKRRMKAAENWPVLSENLSKARSLNEEMARAELLGLWRQTEQLQLQDADAAEQEKNIVPVNDADMDRAWKLEKDIQMAERRLKNFSALVAFTLQDHYELVVTSEADGHRIDITGDSFEVTEAVKVEIPGVAEFHLSAADLNVEETKAALIEKREALATLLGQYDVPTVSDLSKLKRTREDDLAQIARLRRGYADSLKKVLGNRSLEELKAEYDAASAIKTRGIETILADMRLIIAEPIGNYILRAEQQLNGYVSDYESEIANSACIAALKTEIESYTSDLTIGDQIPESIRRISDPKKETERLKTEEILAGKAKEQSVNDLMEARAVIQAEEAAENYLSVEELEEIVSDCEEQLAQKKAEYQAWNEIRITAEQILNAAGENPLQQFEDDFREYLSVLSGNGITVTGMNKKLEMDIYSGNNKMTYELLSEGTKDTISLAFRLAVIKYLYPQGGGLAVFDDPFTDMDADRKERACSLLKSFAENNQIIFVTCDRSYVDVLGGNVIEMAALK